MWIYKILRSEEWSELLAQGEIPGAPIDVADGYVHFSTAEQLRETAEKHFTSEPNLVLLAVNYQALGDQLKWEPSRGGALFPHLYGPLRLLDVSWSAPLMLAADGRHIFPSGVR
ncbi:MAG: DUF952 domain-containing protein [Pseudomonadota bacterium]